MKKFLAAILLVISLASCALCEELRVIPFPEGIKLDGRTEHKS